MLLLLLRMKTKWKKNRKENKQTKNNEHEHNSSIQNQIKTNTTYMQASHINQLELYWQPLSPWCTQSRPFLQKYCKMVNPYVCASVCWCMHKNSNILMAKLAKSSPPSNRNYYNEMYGANTIKSINSSISQPLQLKITSNKQLQQQNKNKQKNN